MNYFEDPTISVIIPSGDLDSYTYQLFLKFASIGELEGNYALKSTLRKIEDYENPPSVKVKPEVLEDDGEDEELEEVIKYVMECYEPQRTSKTKTPKP
jgi:hypothetical protein